MNKLIYYAALAGNVALLAAVAAIFIGGLDRDAGRAWLVSFALALPPLFSLAALAPPGRREERRLRQEISMARLRKELRDLASDA